MGTSPFLDRLLLDWNLGAPSGSKRTKAPLKRQGRGAQVSGWELGIFSGFICRVLNTRNTGSFSPEGDPPHHQPFPGAEQRGRTWGTAGSVPEVSFYLCGGDRVPQVLAAAGSSERRPSRSQSCPLPPAAASRARLGCLP